MSKLPNLSLAEVSKAETALAHMNEIEVTLKQVHAQMDAVTVLTKPVGNYPEEWTTEWALKTLSNVKFLPTDHRLDLDGVLDLLESHRAELKENYEDAIAAHRAALIGVVQNIKDCLATNYPASLKVEAIESYLKGV